MREVNHLEQTGRLLGRGRGAVENELARCLVQDEAGALQALLKQRVLRGVDARLAAARRGGAVGGLLCGFLFSSRRLGAQVACDRLDLKLRNEN